MIQVKYMVHICHVSSQIDGFAGLWDTYKSATPSQPAGLVGLIMVGWFNQSTHLWSCAPPETYVKPQMDDFYEESPKNKGWNSHFQVFIILGGITICNFGFLEPGKRSMKPVRCWTASVPWETAKPNAPRFVNLLTLQDRGENCVLRKAQVAAIHCLKTPIFSE